MEISKLLTHAYLQNETLIKKSLDGACNLLMLKIFCFGANFKNNFFVSACLPKQK